MLSTSKYLSSIIESLSDKSFLLDHLPVGCYIAIVSDIDINAWDGESVLLDAKTPKLLLPNASVSIFPQHALDITLLEALFSNKKYQKETWFVSSKMESCVIKTRNNIQNLAYKILETLKSVQMSQKLRSMFYMFHELFQVNSIYLIA